MSRKAIFDKLRSYSPSEDAPLPDEGPWIQYEDLVEQFAGAVQAVGGQCVELKSLDDLEAACQNVEHYQRARRVCAVGVSLAKHNVDLDTVDDPHDLEDLDFVAVRGEVAVAENGAVWVPGEPLAHRVAPFITQHLAIVVSRDDVVHNMHDAYREITLTRPGYGVFMSGPSKTADIEQSLVIGAHGPRSLVVFVIA